jgi:NAD(P)-dependent dehydrogenase (short-subunit alcohol dehydrogenase family)
MTTVFMSGVSSGFGKLTVPLLLEKGHTVIAGLRGGRGRLDSVFPMELLQYPGRLHGMELDLERSSDFPAIAKLINEKFDGKLEVLINNAGMGLMGVLEDQTEEQIRHQMEINFFGTIFLTRALLPSIRHARGRILNVSSVAGMSGFPFYGSYCASKFALEGMMECLYYDVKHFGVQVGSIEPGGFRTGFMAARQVGIASRSSSSPYFGRSQSFEKSLDLMAGRLDDPMKVARLIARLSDCRRVPLRNWIGKDAFFIRILNAFFPERLKVSMIGNAFNIMLKRMGSS